MSPARLHLIGRAVAALIVLTGGSLAPLCLTGQTTPVRAPGEATSNAQMPTDMQTQLHKLQDALKAAPTGDEKIKDGELNRIGDIYFRTSNFEIALEYYNRALKSAHSVKDARGEAAALSGLGNCYRDQGQSQKALAVFQQALDLATSSGDELEQATALNGVGSVDNNIGQNKTAGESYDRALALARKAGDSDLEAMILCGWGQVNALLGSNENARDDYDSALKVFRQIGDRFGEATALNDAGILEAGLGEMQKAWESYDQALVIRRDIGDRFGEAWTLTNIGNADKTHGKVLEALDQYDGALRIFRKVGARRGEAAALNNIGGVYSQRAEYRKALDYYERAWPILNQAGDRASEAAMLSNVGLLYYTLGKNRRALDYYQRALPIRREVGDRSGEATTLNDIGVVYWTLGENQTALKYLNRALDIRRGLSDHPGEAATLTNIGNVNNALGLKRKALEFYGQALSSPEASGDSDGEAGVLNNLGYVHQSIGEEKEALSYFERALPMAVSAKDPIEEARIFCNMMRNQRTSEPGLAIFYGKHAIDMLQQARVGMHGLDKELQRSFLASKEGYYRDLAALLIDQDRLPEALQVLNLLKQREYSDYVRGEIVEGLGLMARTPAERDAEEEYQELTADIVSAGEQWAYLRRIKRTLEQDKELEKLSDRVNEARKRLHDYFARLYEPFGKNSEANRRLDDVKSDVSALEHQLEKMPNTVALYTIVTPDAYRVIVITGNMTVARSYRILDKNLYGKVEALQRGLRNKASDPRPPAQELYKILIAPVKKDLDQAKAQTLVWSLDDVLRYVPVAALYDGKQYMVEKYSMVTITHASIPLRSEGPKVSSLSAAAMGISRKYEGGLNPLPSVVKELNAIVKDPKVPGAHGVLPGSILLNDQFTEKAMENELSLRHPVVHIASHFVFKPGDDSQSFLLLAGKDKGGTAYHLTVEDFGNNRNLELNGTDLLTLSACETGMTSNASNGLEVDGMGTTAQRNGARAVISTLWEVDDTSTGELMADFYRRWANGKGKVSKVEALRMAQLDLLQGNGSPVSNSSGRGLGIVNDQHRGSAGFTHPYYWAPFVLMGDWR
jgi:CHAT domain-containing protein/Tfp pilus assembly protein PilF